MNSKIQYQYIKIGTHSVHVGSCKKDQLTKLVICDITLNALFFPFMFAPPANLTFGNSIVFHIICPTYQDP